MKRLLWCWPEWGPQSSGPELSPPGYPLSFQQECRSGWSESNRQGVFISYKQCRFPHAKHALLLLLSKKVESMQVVEPKVGKKLENTLLLVEEQWEWGLEQSARVWWRESDVQVVVEATPLRVPSLSRRPRSPAPPETLHHVQKESQRRRRPLVTRQTETAR